MTIAALVPMRHESERVKHKNFRQFCGQPLCEHILTTLDAVPEITSIVIDTDSDSIARIAENLTSKATILKRPDHLTDGRTSINRVIEHDLLNTDHEIYLQTHCTNPLLRPDTISRALSTYLERQDSHDSLFSVTPFRRRFFFGDGTPVNHDLNNVLRTQDMEPLYHQNGNIYVFSRAAFFANMNRIGEWPFMFEMHEWESFDIDTEEDFVIAEALFSAMAKTND